ESSKHISGGWRGGATTGDCGVCPVPVMLPACEVNGFTSSTNYPTIWVVVELPLHLQVGRVRQRQSCHPVSARILPGRSSSCCRPPGLECCTPCCYRTMRTQRPCTGVRTLTPVVRLPQIQRSKGCEPFPYCLTAAILSYLETMPGS